MALVLPYFSSFCREVVAGLAIHLFVKNLRRVSLGLVIENSNSTDKYEGNGVFLDYRMFILWG
jgi:hypothetical protein